MKTGNNDKINNIPPTHTLCQYNKFGEFESSFVNQTEAEAKTKVHRPNINECVLGKRETAGGYYWINVSDVTETTSREIIAKQPKHKVFQFNKDGSFVAGYFSAREASEKTSACRKSIGKCLKGLLNSSGGFIWKDSLDGYTENDSKPMNVNVVSQYDSVGEFIARYDSPMDAELKNGFSRKGIAQCCNGNSKTYKGYHWKYDNK